MQNRREKELSIERKRKQHELELRLQKEQAEIIREENLENNERIERADVFRRQQILDKIEQDKIRADALQVEKEKLKMLRFQAKQDAEKKKAIILEKFEALKKKGRFGPEDLNSLDIGFTSKTED